MDWDQMSGEGPGMCGSDRDLFGFMWRKAEPNPQGVSPLEMETAAENLPMPQYIQEAYLPPVTDPAVGSGMFPINGNMLAQEEMRTCVTPGPASCLGPESAVYGGQLQCFIHGELSDYKTYTSLSKRTSGRTSKLFSSIAACERRHARRLATAYFLITGVEYWPMDQVSAHLEGAYMATLRVRFQEEQAGAAAYEMAAEQTGDPCLRELYLELSIEERGHSMKLRELLESMQGT